MKLKNKMLSIVGAGTFIAPVALSVSCGTKLKHVDVGFVTGGDGTLSDGYFGPMYHAVENAANGEKLAAGGVEVASGEGEAGQKNATANLIDRGAKVIFQPGFENSRSILDNAAKYPNTKFVGVSYTSYVTAVKAFSVDDKATTDANLAKIPTLENLGLMHFKMQELGFELGYLGAARYFAKAGNEKKTDLTYSLYSAKAYQDITALLDGFIAGVTQYGAANHKTMHKIAPLATGKYFTDVTVEQHDFASANEQVANYLNGKVGLFMVGEPNALKAFENLDAVQVADGGEYKEYPKVEVASNKNWDNAFGNALKAATDADGTTFKAEYHDKMHLSTLDNKELQIYPKGSADADKTAADAALKAWEVSLNSSPAKDIYTKDDGKGNETDPNTCGGLGWLSALNG